jgi:hypothetical protein
MGNYDDIGIPVQGQPVSSGAFGIKVRNYLINADSRLSAIEGSQGVIARGQRITNSSTTSGTTELGVLRVDNIPVYAGRLYRISTGPIIIDGSVANDAVRAVLRGDTTGVATTASPQMAIAQMVVPNISLPETLEIDVPYAPAADGTLSVLLSIVRQTGTGVFQALGAATIPINLVVSGEGIDPGDTGVDL